MERDSDGHGLPALKTHSGYVEELEKSLKNISPLAVGVGAGAGGLSSAVLAALLGHFRDSSSGPEPFVCPSNPFSDPAPRLDFYFGLALGTLLGIAAGALLDLIYLARQHLTVSLRNRLASLTLSRLELVEQDNRDLRARVSRLESEGYVLVRDGQERPATPPRSAGNHLPYPAQASSPELPQAAASSSTLAPSSVSSAAPSENLRQQVADEIGAYLKRCLAGNNRGSSGREKVNLANRIYVVVRDKDDRIYDPVRVCHSWRDTQPLVTLGPGPGRQFGDSVFVGFPSQWEAKRAVAAAGLSWPADGPDFDYGLLAIRGTVAEASPWVALVVAGEGEDGEIIVALPGKAPLDNLSVRLWIGRLSSDWPRYAEVVVVGEVDLELGATFGDTLEAEHTDCIPFASDLVEAAGDRISYQTAEEEPDLLQPAASDRGGPPPAWATRVEELERGMTDVQKGIQEILGKLGGPGERKAEKPAAPRPSALRPRSAHPTGATLTGLDPAVVQAARAAGVPESHLAEMAQVVSQSRTKLKDPAPATAGPSRPQGVSAGPLDETEEEDDAEEDVPLPGGDQMVAAITKLTAVAESLSAWKRRATTLEGLLEGNTGADGSGSAGAGRRNAAALKILRRGLVERPRELADGMLERMGADFGFSRSLPGADRVPVTARAWVESRARIQQQFPTTVRMAWILSGIVDALARGDNDEGLARSLVGLAAIEQLSLDRGSWTLAEPMLLEEPAPLSSFHGRQMPTGSEQPFTRLLDARSIDQVREVDEYLERRRRLGSRRAGPTAPTDEDEDGEKDHGAGEDPRGWRGKPKAKPKAKTAAGRGETA
ncbi:unnamed protein product [Symbiodinium necroappetens]|uniref:Uncharacterized protein n=1 Tax=Symbiodinium necroappetens TaxID=1628268 RepID=A0A813BZ57_9DINO|nr:unnamed protein product [Symbiodinium necroappetens]